MNLLQLNNFRPAPESEPVDLCFEPGQIGVVLGRNDSGKTNLLRAVAGLDSRSTGDVLLDGTPMPALRTGKRSVGFVFQAFVNYPHWSVRQNIESPMLAGRGGAKPLKGSERRQRVERIAETLQLSDLLDRQPAELSGGQQQRLAIGRALASDARVLLLDEPFVNLDFRLRERLTEELAQLLRGTNTTAIFASSDCKDAFALGDSLVLLDNQQVLQHDSPLTVYRSPTSLEAAHLMSEPAVNWLVPEASQPSSVSIIRPEHMELVTRATSLHDGAAIQRAQFRLRVDAVETSGSHTFIQGALVEPEDCNTTKQWVARVDGIPDVSRLGGAAMASTENTLLFEVDRRNVLELSGQNVTFNQSVLAGANHGEA